MGSKEEELLEREGKELVDFTERDPMAKAEVLGRQEE